MPTCVRPVLQLRHGEVFGRQGFFADVARMLPAFPAVRSSRGEPIEAGNVVDATDVAHRARPAPEDVALTSSNLVFPEFCQRLHRMADGAKQSKALGRAIAANEIAKARISCIEMLCPLVVELLGVFDHAVRVPIGALYIAFVKLLPAHTAVHEGLCSVFLA